MTEYIVFQAMHPNPEHWEEIARRAARSAHAAIKDALVAQSRTEVPNAIDDGGGLLVAVPARSWKPVLVKVETKTALKFS